MTVMSLARSIGPAMVCLLFIAGCRADVPVYLNRFNPAVDASKYEQLKGRAICFPYVTNDDNRTSIWAAYSADQRVRYVFYKDDIIPNNWTLVDTFAWLAAEKYLSATGLLVLTKCQMMAECPEVRIILKRFNDQYIFVDVVVYRKGRTKFQTSIKVAFDPMPAGVSAEDNPREYEKRMLENLDKLFQTIVDDPAVRMAAF